MKIWKYILPNEVVTIGELYKRFYEKTGTYLEYQIFLDCVVRRCNKLEIIPFSASNPYRVTRDKNFSEKVLDFIKGL